MSDDEALQGLYPFLHGSKAAGALNQSLSIRCRKGAASSGQMQTFFAEQASTGGHRQDARRCLPPRRPPVLHGQWRLELRCFPCRGRVLAPDNGGPPGADRHRPQSPTAR